MAFGRREFLGLAAGAAIGAAASPAAWHAVRDLTRLSQDPPWLPGLPRDRIREVASVSLSCPSGLGVSVLLAGGRPILVRGNPDHPLSQGGITPPAQAEAYALHHPARVREPLLRNAAGEFEPVSWAKALELLAGKLSGAGRRVMAVGPARESTLQDLLASFMERIAPGGYFRMPSEAATARMAAALMGVDAQPGYDLDNAKGLALLGADVFESMPASPHFRKAWSGRDRAASLFFGPVRGATAALCGRWSPLPAGEEAVLAMGLAWHLADMGRVTGKAPDMAEFLALAGQRFGPEEVRRLTGLSPESLRRTAGRIADGALAVPGSPSGEGLGLAPFVAGLALSVACGRVNRPGGVYLTRTVPGQGSAAPGPDLAGRLKDQALGLAEVPDVLLLVEADPVAGLPSSGLAARAVAKAGFKASFTSLMNPSARLCDLILPAPMPLERFGDVCTPYGLAFACFGLARPLVRPLADARHPGDVLLDLAARLGRPLQPSTFRQALRSRVSRLEGAGGFAVRAVMPWGVLAGQPQPAPEADLWRALREGRLWADPMPAPGELGCGAKFLARALAPEAIDLSLPLRLAPQATLRTGTPGQGLPLQSVTSLRPDEVEGGVIVTGLDRGEARGSSFAEAASGGARGGLCVARLNAATAHGVRVKAGEKVRVVGPAGEISAVVRLDESVMDGHVALLAGLGDGAGASVRRVESSLPEPGFGPDSRVQAWAGCRVRLEKA